MDRMIYNKWIILSSDFRLDGHYAGDYGTQVEEKSISYVMRGSKPSKQIQEYTFIIFLRKTNQYFEI